MDQPRSLESLRTSIISKQAVIGIFGAGYVGLPLACAFAEAGFRTIAGDTDRRRIDAIREGKAYVEDEYVRTRLPRLVANGQIEHEGDPDEVAARADVSIITVPTPLDDSNEPDLSSVISVTKTLAEKLRPGRLVVLESSVYPGTTEEVVLPILEKSGLKVGMDFGLAHSPERIDYNNPKYSMLDIPKVVGGVTSLCTKITCELYEKILKTQVVPVSNARTAEATKMLENTYRYVNIALVNELAILHEKLGIDFFEVISAAATKPFGFQPFYPGPGVGGHCIPKDPHYLAFKARKMGMEIKLIEIAAEINEGMAQHIVERLERSLKSRGRSLDSSKVVLLGLAFKANVSDTRRSPAIPVADLLTKLGAQVLGYDPYAKEVLSKTSRLVSANSLESATKGAEALILITPHSAFRSIGLRNLASQMLSGATIFDTRGFWSSSECNSVGLNYLGLGRP